MLWTSWVIAARKRCAPTGHSRGSAGATSSRRRRALRSRCRRPVRWSGRPPRGRGSRVGDTAQPFAGVTLQFAKAPFGNDEKDVIAKLLAPFEEQDRDQGRAHDRPVERRGRDLRDELRGPEPVRRQLPDEHRPDGPRHEGRARGAEHAEVARRAGVRVDEGEVHPEHDQEEHLPGQALRPAVHHRRHGRLLQQGPAREGRRHEHPDEHDPARRRGEEGRPEGRRRHLGLPGPDDRTRTSTGTSSTTTSTTGASTSSPQDGRGGDVHRPAADAQALQAAVDMFLKYKVAAAGRPVRPRRRRRALQGGAGRLPPRRAAAAAGLPRRRSSRSSGTSSTRWPRRAASGRSSRPPATG